MSDPARVSVAVTFLADDPDARRLVLAWPTVEPGLRDSALTIAWVRASGVPASKVRRLGELLMRHQLVRDDRSIDPEAQKVIAHVAAQSLRDSGRRGR